MSLTIGRGERVGLAARSGEGKSTLARFLLGLEKDTEGAVTIEGLSAVRFAAAYPGQLTVISQNYLDAVDPALSVAEILVEPVQLALTRAKSAERDKLLALLNEQVLAERLAQVGLPAKLLPAHARSLSGGELKRVCIARALITNPRFVVFDEALSSLDALVQSRILELIETLADRGAAWLFISHDLRVLSRLCDRILFLQGGHIVEDVPSQSLAHAQSPAARELVEAALARHISHQSVVDHGTKQ